MSMKMRTQSVLLADTCTGIIFGRDIYLFFCQVSLKSAEWEKSPLRILLQFLLKFIMFWLNDIFSLMIF